MENEEIKIMTEKRFYYAHGVVWDTKKPNGLNGISINDLDKGLRVANWLNELNDENEQLKKEVKALNDFIVLEPIGDVE